MLNHKLEKYRAKVMSCDVASKRAIYVAKIKHYERKLQMGQEGGGEREEKIMEDFGNALNDTEQKVGDFVTNINAILERISEANKGVEQKRNDAQHARAQKIETLNQISMTVDQLNKWVAEKSATVKTTHKAILEELEELGVRQAPEAPALDKIKEQQLQKLEDEIQQLQE